MATYTLKKLKTTEKSFFCKVFIGAMETEILGYISQDGFTETLELPNHLTIGTTPMVDRDGVVMQTKSGITLQKLIIKRV